MGQDKATLEVTGRSLLEIALSKLRTLPLARAPRIVGPYSDQSALADQHPGCGPLSGIEAALAASNQPWNVILPVDMPLLPTRFLRWLLRRAQITEAMVTLPRIGGNPQPLCAVYHRNLLAAITASLPAGNYKVLPVVCLAADQPQALDIFDVEMVASTDPDFPAFSSMPLYRWFHNCNRPEDLDGLENALV